MQVPAQVSLFGAGLMAVPEPNHNPDPEAIRLRLNALLDSLRVAGAMPLTDRDARLWQIVRPNMCRWLPDQESAAIRAGFAKEMQRLEAPQTRN